MSKIKGKDTGPEILVRKFLHNCGFRYRLHSKKLPGKPDIVLKKLNTIIDVRGCFWHGHKNCKFGDQIRSESIGINERIKSAIERDRVKMEKWKNMGANGVLKYTLIIHPTEDIKCSLKLMAVGEEGEEQIQFLSVKDSENKDLRFKNNTISLVNLESGKPKKIKVEFESKFKVSLKVHVNDLQQ